MSKKRILLSFSLLYLPLTILSESLLLTPPFSSIKDSKIINKVLCNTPDPVFYIIVPESYTLPSERPQTLLHIEAFTKGVSIPSALLGEKSQEEKTPCVLFLDWKEQESITSRKKIGDILAEKINNLQYRFKSARFVLLSCGQGANVINHASESFRKPVDIVIQLMPPVFSVKEKEKNKAYATFSPHKKNIKHLFTFYSDHEFCMLHPTLHPSYNHYYAPQEHDHQKNTLLLINNDHPLPVDIMSPTVGKRIISLCNTMQLTYPHHTHLIAHINNVHKESDMMIVLKDGSNCITDQSLAKEINTERIISNAHTKKLQKILNRPLKTSLSKNEITRRSYESIKKLTEQVKVS